jgi:hypothetical protein
LSEITLHLVEPSIHIAHRSIRARPKAPIKRHLLPPAS